MVELTIEDGGVQVSTIKVSHPTIGLEEGGENTPQPLGAEGSITSWHLGA